MFALTQENAGAYLQDRWPQWRATAPPIPLGGGVSNAVLLVHTIAGRIVLKQALEKLNVAEDWRSSPLRTLREAAALRDVAGLLPSGSAPLIQFHDAENCIYAMEAAPEGATDWKTRLLSADVDPEVASTIGKLLAAQVRGSWRKAEWAERYGDQTVFDELRLDPYYRSAARRNPDLQPQFAALIERCRIHKNSLVHGDWSPKNFLIAPGRVIAIDYEVVHFGDPCFDAAFLLNHLLLKSVHMPALASGLAECMHRFWREMPARILASEDGVAAHLGGLMLARVDGKSPAEYLREPERRRVRALARDLMLRPPATVPEVWQHRIASCL